MRKFLGIDGGGTSTRAIVLDESGRVTGQGKAGPSNYHNVGMATAVANIAAAAAMAGVANGADAAFLGLAGVRSRIDETRLASAAEAAGLAAPGGVTVANDLHNALAGGLNGGAGVALIAGTGSNCLGMNESGRHFMCGGWGWLLDDRGAGFGLATDGLRAVSRAADGRAAATALLDAAVAHFEMTEPFELLERLYAHGWKPGEVAAFAPTVMRLAAGGDATALGVLRTGAEALAELVATTARALDFQAAPKVVLLGGCLRSDAHYRGMVEDAIRKALPGAAITEPMFDTAYGAALNALRRAGIHPLPRIVFPNH